MSLADIKNKIEADAKKESQQLIEKAQSQVDEIYAKSKAESSSVEDSYTARFKKEEPEILNRREIVAGLDVKKINLDAEQDLITQSFEEAVKVLASIPKEKYLGFVESLLDQAIETGKEVVHISGKDKYLTKTWLDTFNKDHKVSLSLVKDALISGGFVLQNGNISTNCSFDMLVGWIRDDLEADVVKRLFSA